MKWAVVTMLVLIWTSASSGAIKISVNGIIDQPFILMKVSETKNIGIWGDGQTQGGIFYLGIGEYNAASLDISYAHMYHAGVAPIWVDDYDVASALGVWNPFIAVEFYTPPSLQGVLVDNLIFHDDGFGEAILKLFDGDGNLLDEQEFVLGIPEPATILLLTLGGLFLRKRGFCQQDYLFKDAF